MPDINDDLYPTESNFPDAYNLIVDPYGKHEGQSDENCDACWKNYPVPCECGGFIHAEFGDEDSDCNYWLYTRCDTCGESE